ncbi:MAG TPA: polyprenyl synthetase family protein [Pyrinomonadaceae bacterium]|nr:polyprenyl synthetase family protein [Pyrinomonadaceae bacterium]
MQIFSAAKETVVPQAAARKIFGLIKRELELVEAEFERQAASNIQVINYLGDYLRASGGKRVRPAMLILSTHGVGGDGKADNSIRLATVMEMLHTATLVHDDIIDNADLRRSRASVNAKFGNQAAVLMGDWLYMSAFETSLKERSLEILDILTRLTRKMTEGELIQLTMIGNAAITRDEYFDILRRKTAYLFSGCCEIGAIIGGASHEQQEALRDYGMNLGIAFQLADDVLDFTSDDQALGKAAGADLLEGKITLPLILLQESAPDVRADLERVMHDGVYDDATRAAVSEKLREHATLDEIRQIALSFATAARKNLEILPESEYRLALDEIPNFVIDRNN